MSSKAYLRNPNFFKRNYFKALKYILPAYLYEDDISETPKEDDLIDTIINSHIDIANNFSSILNVSAVSNSAFSSINTIEGITPYFVKQNNLTNITTQSFEDNILSYFDKKFKDFETETQFSTYVQDTVISAINLNNPDSSLFSSIGDSSAIHNYLIANLSWMYFLNTSGSTYDPSSYVKDLIVKNLYSGTPVNLSDGIKGLSEYVWRNNLTSYYPSATFASGARSDLSGTQQLEKLKTWNDVIYSPLFADGSDFRVKDKFETYIDSNLKSSEKVESGPFARLIRALSFFAFDINNDTEEISTLYDIDDCPDDYLPLIAQLIGWDLFGNDPSRWRLQLRNAVSIYKSVGTKKSVQSTINTVFPKDQFPIEGRITELWESYIPYLIYYALATESEYFRSFQSWTPSIASEMGIEKYSTSSMDDNIRLAVDKIILDTVRQFPDQFPLTEWLTNEVPVFNYRGREYPIPPFEEYPYYVNTELGNPQITFIADRLACFGVRQQFAIDVSSYITSNAITDDDEPRTGSWLIFTSGYNSPPNLDNLIRNLNDNRFDYASLWSGKSSHFKLVLQASEFDFTKNGLDEIGNGDALDFVAQSINKMAPAHSIPLVSLEVSGPPETLSIEGSCLPHIYLDREEIDVAAGNNTFTSGIYLNTYKRGINTGGNVIGKSATQSLVSPELVNVSSIGSVPRNTSRRRSYEKIMPFNGYYDRTGFNMPVGVDMASGLSGIPLGLIPSSLTYTPVTDHINLPNIWSQCENLSSNNSYYEYDVSNTQVTRGLNANFQANTDRTTDRGQLPGIYAAMHRVSEREKYLRAELQVGIDALQQDLITLQNSNAPASSLSANEDKIVSWTSGVTLSYATSATNDGSAGYTFPNGTSDYYNFEFGRDLHRLFNIYKESFYWHRLSPDIQMQDGANIFSHAYGPLLYNHGFENILDNTYVTTSLTDPERLTVTGTAFTGVTAFVASAASSMYLNTFERVASGIVDNVELVLTSGTEDDSSFSIVKVPGTERSQYEDPFLYDRTFIMMRSGVGAATRFRFDISKYSAPSNHPISNNFLLPNHTYSLNFDSLISNDARTIFGGRSVNVWIHTKPEDGKMWSFNSEGDWVQHTQLLSRQDLIQKYSHSKFLPVETREPQFSPPTSNGINLTFSNRNLECIDQVTNLPSNSNVSPSPLIGITEDDFKNFQVNFDTRNRDIRLPNNYLESYGQLHRQDQEYVVEIFTSPGGQPDTYMILDKVEIQDLTMKRLSEIFAAGTKSDPLCVLDDLKRGCLEYHVELTKQDLFDIFKHFNNIAGKNAATAYASRDKDKTQTIMESEGGSRIDYRYVNELADIVYVTLNLGINTITFDI